MSNTHTHTCTQCYTCALMLTHHADEDSRWKAHRICLIRHLLSFFLIDPTTSTSTIIKHRDTWVCILLCVTGARLHTEHPLMVDLWTSRTPCQNFIVTCFRSQWRNHRSIHKTFMLDHFIQKTQTSLSESVSNWLESSELNELEKKKILFRQSKIKEANVGQRTHLSWLTGIL